MSKFELEDRLAVFGEKIIVISRKIRWDLVTKPIVSQLIRSSTSIGANYCEANNASSFKDFRNKLYICKKEAQETKYWLRMLAKSDKKIISELRILYVENLEILKIIQSIII